MTIRDFLSLFVDEKEQAINIFDFGKSEEIFTGDWYALEESDCEDLLDACICSIDNLFEPTTIITINIDTKA